MINQEDIQEYNSIHTAFRHLKTVRHNSFASYMAFTADLCAILMSSLVKNVGKLLLSFIGVAVSRSLSIYARRIGLFANGYYHRMKILEGEGSGIVFIDNKVRIENGIFENTTGFTSRINISYSIGVLIFVLFLLYFLGNVLLKNAQIIEKFGNEILSLLA